MDGRIAILRYRRLLNAIYALTALVCAFAVLTCCGTNAASTKWSLSAPELSGSGYSLQLNSEQKDDCAAAYYTIIRIIDEIAYYPAMSSIPVDVDESGQIVVPGDPDVLVATNENDMMLCGVEYTHDDDGSPQLVTESLRFCASHSIAFFAGSDIVSLAVKPNNNSDGLDFDITDFDKYTSPGSDSASNFLSQYRCLQMLWHEARGKTRAIDGSLLPISEWEKTGYVGWGSISWNDSATFELIPASSYEDAELLLQVVVEDTEGNLHGSELVEIQSKAPETNSPIEVPTERGLLKFEITDGQATLSSYEGEDETVSIPEMVDGAPVTSIGKEAFRDSQYLHEVVLPDSIEEIKDEAFAYSQIRRFSVPAKLKRLGGAVFFGAVGLREFVQSEPNGFTSVRDGVLYSVDGSTLLAYPAAKGPAFEVPEGVTAIGYAAFASTYLERVALPESLRIIDDCAFANCRDLENVELPGNLERIGASAFGFASRAHYVQLDRNAELVNSGGSIFIGRNVSAVGKGAFDALNLQTIEVDSQNPWYSAKNGFLLTKDGILLQAPSGLVGAIEIPEGTTVLTEGSLSSFQGPQANDGTTGLVDIFLPESLQQIEEGALPKTAAKNDMSWSSKSMPGVFFHAPKDSWAESYAQEQGIDCDNASSLKDLTYEITTISLRKAELSFKLFEDHAVLVGIDADDIGHVEIPAEVSGRPVTAIGSDKNDKASGTAKTIIIPKSVERIEGELLAANLGVRRFEVDERNEFFTVREGALYSTDGTVLIAYPQARTESYVVPEGTVEIANYAFRGAKIQSVQFPEGLRSIGAWAFYSCSDLSEVRFPSTLEYIGENAFGDNLRSIGFNEGLERIARNAFGVSAIYNKDGLDAIDIPDSVTEIGDSVFWNNDKKELVPVATRTVHIGQNLSKIGSNTFEGLGIDNFTVSAENEHFKAEGPFLLSKDGRILYRCAGAADAELRVPDGVEGINDGAFRGVLALTDVYIPNSVLRISSIAFDKPGPSDDKEPVRLHCPSGSEAARIAEALELNWVES